MGGLPVVSRKKIMRAMESRRVEIPHYRCVAESMLPILLDMALNDQHPGESFTEAERTLWLMFRFALRKGNAN